MHGMENLRTARHGVRVMQTTTRRVGSKCWQCFTRPHSLIPKLATFQAHLGSRSCLLSDYHRSSSSMRSVQWRVIDGVDDNANKENVSGIILGFIRENNYGDAPCGR